MQQPSLSEPRRLHVAAIPVWAADVFKRFGLALIPLIAVRGPESFVVLVVVLAGLVTPVIRYLLFTYRLDGDALIVSGGLVPRWRRVIPTARVQSVDRVQKLRHRLLGVVELRVEAAGGAGTEAALVALSPAEAERIRSALVEQGRGAETQVAPPALLVSLSPPELLLAGVTGGRVAVIAAMLAWLQEALPDQTQESILQRVAGTGAPALLLVAVAVAAFLLVAFAFSIAATILVYWNFTIASQGQRLVIERGLLEQRRSTVPLRRVQAVVVHENLIRRALGLAALSVVVAGYAGPKEEQEQTSMLLPIGKRSDAFRLAARVLDVPADLAAIDLQPAPRRALLRRMWLVLVPGTVALGAAVWWLDGIGAIGAVVPVAGAAMAYGGWSTLGHAVEKGCAVVRSGLWVRKTSIVPIGNVQQLQLGRGPLQRLHRLASVTLRIPKAQPAAVDLDEARARDRFVALAEAMVARG